MKNIFTLKLSGRSQAGLGWARAVGNRGALRSLSGLHSAPPVHKPVRSIWDSALSLGAGAHAFTGAGQQAAAG